MNGPARRIANGIAAGAVAILVLGIVCQAAGARINTTGSIPVGLYWTSGAAAGKGAYVLFCPPPHFRSGVFEDARERGYIGAGFCPGGFGYMMKRVLGTAGDAVAVSDDGVRINGRLLALSVPLKADKGGRPLPRCQPGRYVLGNDEVLLMSDVSAISFDGRYFGPVKLSQIRTVITPVLTW